MLARTVLFSSCLADNTLAILFLGISCTLVKMSKGEYEALKGRQNAYPGASNKHGILTPPPALKEGAVWGK